MGCAGSLVDLAQAARLSVRLRGMHFVFLPQDGWQMPVAVCRLPVVIYRAVDELGVATPSGCDPHATQSKDPNSEHEGSGTTPPTLRLVATALSRYCRGVEAICFERSRNQHPELIITRRQVSDGPGKRSAFGYSPADIAEINEIHQGA